MLQLNNPAVLAHVRQIVLGRVSEGVLDEPSAALVLRAVGKAAQHGPCGWIFALAEALGATAERAMDAAAVAHLFYSAFDVTDDVQDGDAAAYLGDAPPALQVNVAMHLWILAGLMLERFGPGRAALHDAIFADISRAVCGQRADLTREAWCTRAYEAMIRRIGGAQFSVYTALVAEAAGLPHAALAGVAVALSSLVQLESDRAGADARVACLPPRELDELRDRLARELDAAMMAAPASARPVLERLARSARAPASVSSD